MLQKIKGPDCRVPGSALSVSKLLAGLGVCYVSAFVVLENMMGRGRALLTLAQNFPSRGKPQDCALQEKGAEMSLYLCHISRYLLRLKNGTDHRVDLLGTDL